MTNYVDYKKDSTGQYIFADNGDYIIIDKVDELKQRCKNNLSILLGEWFEDTTQGISYIKVIFNPLSTPQNRDSEIRRVLLNTEGIKSVKSITQTINKTERHLTIKAIVNTIYGQIEVAS